MLLFGGFDGTESLDDIHVLETDRKAWSKVKAVGTKSPKSRYCHVANIVSGRYMLVCGGTHVDAEGQRTALLDTWVLDLSTHSWELLHDSVVPAPLKPESVYAAFSSAEEQHAIIIGASEGLSLLAYALEQ